MIDRKLQTAAFFAILALIIFLIVQSFCSVVEARTKSTSTTPINTVSFRGTSEIKAVPDVALFQVTIREEDKDVKVAQQKMTEKAKKLMEVLAQKNIEEKNIQTTNYSTNPKYVYHSDPCVNGICPPGKQVLAGYIVSETFTIKLYDLPQAGEILSTVSALDINEVSGPGFAIDNPEKLKSQAQAQAIAKAKAQAEATAQNLGVKLIKIVRFFEEPSAPQFPPHPMMAKAMSAESRDMLMPAIIQGGEEKIIANVSITYEIE